MNHKQAVTYLNQNANALRQEANNGDHLASKVITVWALYQLTPNDPKSQHRLVQTVRRYRCPHQYRDK